jgi:hypothetical protein
MVERGWGTTLVPLRPAPTLGPGTEFGTSAEFRPQAKPQLRAQLSDGHAIGDQELAAQHLARLVVIGQLAVDATVLAILIPAEAAVRNRFRAEVLEAAQERILLRNFEGLAEDGDFNQALEGPERLGHNALCASNRIQQEGRLMRLDQNLEPDNPAPGAWWRIRYGRGKRQGALSRA